jgi:hypothetical protein
MLRAVDLLCYDLRRPVSFVLFFRGASYISLGDEWLITIINESINQFPLLLLGSTGFKTQSTLGHVGRDLIFGN